MFLGNLHGVLCAEHGDRHAVSSKGKLTLELYENKRNATA
jgi:hypothetical protein